VPGVPLGVLLVDDAADIRRLIRTALRFRGGFEVVGEAATGAEGVDMAEQLDPDVVVLDLGLPDIAGRDVLARIRDRAPRSKVVIFSGGAEPDRAWFDEQADGYVLKDSALDALVDALETAGNRAGRQVALQLPAQLASVAQARAFLVETFATWGLARLADDGMLVVSELVTNAIRHAGTPCRLQLAADEAAVRIAVTDTGAGSPDPQPFSETESHGRGLRIIGAVSSAWGVDALPDGKIVWADLSRSGA
jgi:CheY-like chemotaxis protein